MDEERSEWNGMISMDGAEQWTEMNGRTDQQMEGMDIHEGQGMNN